MNDRIYWLVSELGRVPHRIKRPSINRQFDSLDLAQEYQFWQFCKGIPCQIVRMVESKQELGDGEIITEYRQYENT
jgi:hypothetical protein